MTDAPTVQAFQAAKADCGEALLLFRLGDFYEAFYDDARTLARLCGLLVTIPPSRDVPMTGFPVHQLDQHLKTLVAAGERVAVCEEAKPAAGADAEPAPAETQRTLFAMDCGGGQRNRLPIDSRQGVAPSNCE